MGDMIGQRPVKQTDRQKQEAYNAATARDGGRCQRCGRFGVVQRDHRQNRTAYNTTPANLQCLCPDCHTWKTEHPREAAEQGFAVSRHESNPANVPAWRFGVGWVFYLNRPNVHGDWWIPVGDIPF